MKAAKRKMLEAAGWSVGTANDFLGLSPGEEAYIGAKLALAHQIRAVRKEKKMSQAAFAKAIHSSQSRVAKMEAGDACVAPTRPTAHPGSPALPLLLRVRRWTFPTGRR